MIDTLQSNFRSLHDTPWSNGILANLTCGILVNERDTPFFQVWRNASALGRALPGVQCRVWLQDLHYFDRTRRPVVSASVESIHHQNRLLAR